MKIVKSQYHYENSFDFMDTLKVSQGPPRDHRPFFENCWQTSVLKEGIIGNKKTRQEMVTDNTSENDEKFN